VLLFNKLYALQLLTIVYVLVRLNVRSETIVKSNPTMMRKTAMSRWSLKVMSSVSGVPL
jgi:hypothetical protein